MTSISAAIGARGFRRWYERQLVESFAHIITGVPSLIMMAIAMEMLEFRSTAGGLIALVAIAAGGGALCIIAWRRVHQLLSRADSTKPSAALRLVAWPRGLLRENVGGQKR